MHRLVRATNDMVTPVSLSLVIAMIAATWPLVRIAAVVARAVPALAHTKVTSRGRTLTAIHAAPGIRERRQRAHQHEERRASHGDDHSAQHVPTA
ncbi:MAG TPA: hypothetical protein VK784_09040 [Pseudonocardiaceae bacterium]|nr:hypothetical protein [Pseudonocardiaceae bacterium]